MPVLDEMTYNLKKASSSQANVSADKTSKSNSRASLKLPNGVIHATATTDLDLLDLSSDDNPANTSSSKDYLHDLLGIGLTNTESTAPTQNNLRISEESRARFSLPSGKTHTPRYIPVRQLTGTRTGRYRAVPLRSTVGDRFRSLTIDFRRRWSISAICCRFKEKSTVGGRLRKKKERRRRRGGEVPRAALAMTLPGGRPIAVAVREPSPPAGDFSPGAGRRNVSPRSVSPRGREFEA
ncbi:hypothetical protein BHM03_00043132, partial [Ensete ventricosum]